MTFRPILGAAALSLFAASLVQADPVTITDIAGRNVTVDAPVDRVILGEGRQIFFAAVLDGENPFARVVGWRDDLRQASPDSYDAYADKSRSWPTSRRSAGSRTARSTLNRRYRCNPMC